MNWTLAIDRNRDALLRLIAMMFAVAGIAPGGSVAALPRRVRNVILRVLQPAEAAMLRLIVIKAHVDALRGIVVAPRPVRAGPAQPIPRGTGAQRLPSFPLSDPRQRFETRPVRYVPGPGPRIFFFDDSDPVIEAAPVSGPDDPMAAERICQRLNVLKRALDTLPRQAKRLAQMQARASARSSQKGKPPPRCPLRPGWPPGYRARASHAVDEVLSDCHSLAFHVLKAPDTS